MNELATESGDRYLSPLKSARFFGTDWDYALVGFRIAIVDDAVDDGRYRSIFGFCAPGGGSVLDANSSQFLGFWREQHGRTGTGTGTSLYQFVHDAYAKENASQTALTRSSGSNNQTYVPNTHPGVVVFMQLNKPDNKLYLALDSRSIGAVNAGITDEQFDTIIATKSILGALAYNDYALQEFTIGPTQQAWLDNISGVQFCTVEYPTQKIFRVKCALSHQ